MTRIELGTGIGSENFTPTDFSYQRETSDGQIPIINYLIGSHFNENLDGLFTLSDTGSPTSSSIANTGGKLNIQLDPNGDVLSTKRATHSTFSYLWPKTRINSNLELATEQVAEITPNVAYTQTARTVFEDLSNGDQIILELHSGNNGTGSGPATNAWFSISEKVNTVITELKRVDLPSGELSIDWQLRFIEEGVSKLFYKNNVADSILLWKGDFNADIAECKVFHEFESNDGTNRTIKFDFLWILYKSIFVGFDISAANKVLGCVCVFDTDGTEVEADWNRVFSKDHEFVGDRVIQNGLIRLRIKDTPEMEVWGWQTFDTPAWVLLGSLIPKNNSNIKATNLVDVIIRKFNDSLVILDVNYGLVTHTYRLAKGMAYVRCNTRSKMFDFKTTKERFALSSDDETTNLLKYNQLHSDDAERGNPLRNYTITNISVANPTEITTSVPHDFTTGNIVRVQNTNSTPNADGNRVVTVTGPTTFTTPLNVTGSGNAGDIDLWENTIADNPAIFTFDQTANTGLGKVDDVWYAFYNPTADDVVGWIGSFLRPNALEVEATSITELKEARFGFDKEILIAIGQINSKPLTKTNGKPKMFFPGVEDEYVKWKANAAIFAFDQNPFMRKRR
jgi:hypothetical protein